MGEAVKNEPIGGRTRGLLALVIGATIVLSACNPPVAATGDGSAKCEPGDPDSFFVEQSGLVVVEAESAAVSGDWLVKTSESGFTGSGYIQWDGDNHFSTPGVDILTYRVRIETPGIYRVIWRGRISIGTDNTEHNDAWIRIPDADYFYGERSDGGGVTYVYPGGIDEQTDVKQEHETNWDHPSGQSKGGWFKAYLNQTGVWKWDANTSDHDAHEIFVEFLSPGTYTLEVSGRSYGFAIDRIVLYQVSTYTENDATNTGHTQSRTVCK